MVRYILIVNTKILHFRCHSVGLAYANIELKNEVQNLSLRVIESNFKKIYLNYVVFLKTKKFSS